MAVKITFVVFRGEVVAIFRATKLDDGKWQKELPRYSNGIRMLPCYAHVGQHGECGEFLLKYRRATNSEYADLLDEMTGIGYDVTVVQHGRITTTELTGYACVWSDDYDGEFGVYKVFLKRGEALDFMTDTVFERAKLLEVDVLDSNGWKRELTREEVRDQLASGMGIQLAWSFNDYGDPDEFTSMHIDEVTIG